MSKLTGVSSVDMFVHEAKNLDTTCFRGYAPLAHLALVSQADVFDQITNSDGLQRDLSPKHASDAYNYVQRDFDVRWPRAFPEVVLNVRDKKVVEIEPIDVPADINVRLFRLRFDLGSMQVDKVRVSRVDGNHRLCLAAGDDRREPLLQNAPFQIHIGLTREQERSLFVDINANQKGLNTSHLAIMQSRLTPEEEEIRDHLDRWIAKSLANDPASPWHGLIHLGGSKKGARSQGLTRQVNFVSLKNGVNKTLSKSQYIDDFTDPKAQYAVIRNYWQAVAQVFAEEWSDPKKYVLTKNIGVLSFSILGGTIIDRCIPRSKVDVERMAQYLTQARSKFDWSRDATGDRAVTGLHGNRAALIVAAEMANELYDDESGESIIRSLQDELVGVAPAT